MAVKYPAKGVILKYAATATPTTTIDNCRDVSISLGDRELSNATTHSDTVTKSYLSQPLRDTLEVSGTIVYDPADTIHELMRAHHAAGTLGYLTVVLPDAGAAQWASSGHITQFSIPSLNPETGNLEATFTYKALGAETFTA